MPIIFIRCEANGETRRYVDTYPWAGDSIWSDGNYSCDCNRSVFFASAADETPKKYPPCGGKAYTVRVEDDHGVLLYQDDRWLL